MTVQVVTIEDLRRAEPVIREHISSVPLIRSYPLERKFGFPSHRRVWLKDFGWTPVGSFKLFGALNWMAQNLEKIGSRPVAAHSSGNFASAISYAGMKFKKRVFVVMPESAPKIKFQLTRSFGAEIITYDLTRDHLTGDRERLTREIAEKHQAIYASPYDDVHVIAGNGVGGLEIVSDLKREQRDLSLFLCQVSGGGLMAGHALAIADGFPGAEIVGVEPEGASDFCQSFAAGQRMRIDKPVSICDGLLSYDVGEHNWPVLQAHLTQAVSVPDLETRRAMKWLYDQHGLRAEPSGTIALAAALSGKVSLQGEGDVVIVVSGRNVDEDQFREWISVV